jgi:hypothetical protein
MMKKTLAIAASVLVVLLVAPIISFAEGSGRQAETGQWQAINADVPQVGAGITKCDIFLKIFKLEETKRGTMVTGEYSSKGGFEGVFPFTSKLEVSPVSGNPRVSFRAFGVDSQAEMDGNGDYGMTLPRGYKIVLKGVEGKP